MPTMADLTVELPGWKETHHESSMRQWEDEHGEVFVLDFFALPPDIGASPTDVDGTRRFYRQVLTANGRALPGWTSNPYDPSLQ